MAAQKALSANLQIAAIAKAAGETKGNYYYQDGILFCKTISQAALDTAAAAHNDAAAVDAFKDSKFNDVLVEKGFQTLATALYDHENRIRALEGQPNIGKGAYLDIIKNFWKSL
jgi:hypothetical protein